MYEIKYFFWHTYICNYIFIYEHIMKYLNGLWKKKNASVESTKLKYHMKKSKRKSFLSPHINDDFFIPKIHFSREDISNTVSFCFLRWRQLSCGEEKGIFHSIFIKSLSDSYIKCLLFLFNIIYLFNIKRFKVDINRLPNSNCKFFFLFTD